MTENEWEIIKWVNASVYNTYNINELYYILVLSQPEKNKILFYDDVSYYYLSCYICFCIQFLVFLFFFLFFAVRSFESLSINKNKIVERNCGKFTLILDRCLECVEWIMGMLLCSTQFRALNILTKKKKATPNAIAKSVYAIVFIYEAIKNDVIK